MIQAKQLVTTPGIWKQDHFFQILAAMEPVDEQIKQFLLHPKIQFQIPIGFLNPHIQRPR